jgi:hypothetical protein
MTRFAVALLALVALAFPVRADDDGAPAPAPKAKPAPDGAGKSDAAKKPEPEKESVDRILEAIVRNGGRLPSGFSLDGKTPDPATRFLRPVGRLLLAYLDAKSDPAKAAVYEGILRDVGNLLVEAGDGNTDVSALGLSLAGKFFAGLSDPDPVRAGVYREIVSTFLEALKPPPPKAKRATILLAGAEVAAGSADDGTPAAEVVRVPDGSAAKTIGLRPGDRILAIDGKGVTPQGIAAAERSLGTAGTTVTLRVQHPGGGEERVEVTTAAENVGNR